MSPLKPTKTRSARTWKGETAIVTKTVAWISETRRIRAFGAVVIQINAFGQGVPRTIVIRTTSADTRAGDLARCQRVCKKLAALGVKFTTSLGPFRTCDGISGTIFAYKLA